MSKSNTKAKILILMTGSIACYKACGLISMLVKNGFEVKVAASAAALKFVGEATIEGLTGNTIYSDIWKTGSAMEHIHLERWADLIIAAPASAHFINRIAHGIGDDLLTTIFLAHDFKKPFLIAPAMNTAMYLNPVTQKSLEALKGFGIKILEAASGVLACGETGYGKLLEPDLLFREIQNEIENKSYKESAKTQPQGIKKILVTAGGTREPIDDVRFITNSSTGFTGEKIASGLSELGFDVTLDLAESSTVKPSEAYKLKRYDDFLSLSELLQKQLSEENFDLIVHAAAVSDFAIDKAVGKLSSAENLTLNFKKNPKIVNSLKKWSQNKAVKLIAFKLTSQATDEQIKNKVFKIFEEANADAVVQNDIQSMIDRKRQYFQVFNKKRVSRTTGVEELIGEIVKVGIL